VCRAGNRARPRVDYLTAEEFSSCFVQSMKARDIEGFKARFRDLDMLLLEDVEFLQNKTKMQDEVLSVVKTLQLRGSRVILTSSFAPRELRDLDSQLVSRFCSGFLAAMEKPDLATRRRILQEKAVAQEVCLPEAVIELLAERVASDVRQLESCLCNVILKARLLGRPISTDLACEVLTHYGSDVPLRGIEAIIARVGEGFGLSVPQLCSRNRRQTYVVARHTAFYLARKHTDLSLQEIGDYFGRRHSTVIKGIAAVERELKRETPLGRQIAAALARIEGPG
jgi:chromosomal replication initiator protein